MSSDNAGGGVRGLRARPSQALFEAVRAAYKIKFEAEPVDLGGSSNLNLLVTGSSGQWVLRVYRPYVSAARLDAIQAIRGALSLTGVPCGGLIPTHAGQPWISFDGRLIELEDYIECDADMDTWKALETGLPVLAHMHDVQRNTAIGEAARQPLFANYIESDQMTACTLRGTRRMRAWNPTALELALADEADELALRVSSAESARQADFPKQLVHGDFWDNNVLLREGKVVFVTDFDFMGERQRIEDIALTLFFICMQFFETPVSDDQLARLRRLLDAYDHGTERPLDPAERAALPLAIARQPLWSIGGWVALLDDESAARAHAQGTAAEVTWALCVMDEAARWQEALA